MPPPPPHVSSLLLYLVCAFIFFIFIFSAASAYPLCTNSRAPVTTNVSLPFCSHNGSTCCTTSDDTALELQLRTMNISDAACNSIIKDVLCAKCDPFSFDLYTDESNQKNRTVPTLCSNTCQSNSPSLATEDFCSDFCSEIWETCKGVSIKSSPFSSSSSSSKFTAIWESRTDFCRDFGSSESNNSICFDGKSGVFNNSTQDPPPDPKGLCIEKIGTGSYLNMVAHPDGSDRAFLSNQEGKIWLARVPSQGSGKMLELNESGPFLDLTNVVHNDAEFGMLGIAFHPDFTSNGRFFVSYNCDKDKGTSCAGGRCSCTVESGCDVSKLGTDNGALPCQYQSVIAEFTAQGSSSSSTTPPSSVLSAHPSEVRRIFTMGLPFTTHHAGQILFGPTDGYLYFMMGDGGKDGDIFNFSQNNKSLLGKIMRFDVDKIPSGNMSDLWGNYSIPNDNPYIEQPELRPEIWALGFRNPWRCSFDSERPSYFFCADVGQDNYEEVDLVSKGGNYGWSIYEGLDIFKPSLISNTTTNTIFPAMSYNRSIINGTEANSASITGGYVYRSQTDPCMFGRYLFADLYATHIWEGTESPENSGNYSSNSIQFNCASDSPITCDYEEGVSNPSLQYLFSFGEDNHRDVFILASSGVYRVVPPSRCNYDCPIEIITTRAPPPSPPSSSTCLTGHLKNIIVFFFFFTFAVSFKL